MPAIQGSCHCGAVRIEVDTKPRQLTECNCSICRRYGTLWAYYRGSTARITGRTAFYARREKGIEFHRCRTCGCVTHWAWWKPGSAVRLGINARLLDPLAVCAIPIRMLDGDGRWKTLGRRAQPDRFISPARRGAP